MVNFEQTAAKIEKEFNNFMNILKNNEPELYHSIYPIRKDFLKILQGWYFKSYHPEFEKVTKEVIGTCKAKIKLKTHLRALSGVGLMLMRNNKRMVVSQPDLLLYLVDLLESQEFTEQVYKDVLVFLNITMNVEIID